MFLAMLSFYVVPSFSSFVLSCVLCCLCYVPFFQLGVRAFGGGLLTLRRFVVKSS